MVLSLTDAASALTRLELQHVKVGRERWNALCELAERHMHDQQMAFVDAHISLILSRLERMEQDDEPQIENGRQAKRLTDLHALNVEQFAR